jgi:hypothetical protein
MLPWSCSSLMILTSEWSWVGWRKGPATLGRRNGTVCHQKRPQCLNGLVYSSKIEFWRGVCWGQLQLSPDGKWWRFEKTCWRHIMDPRALAT